MKNEFSIAVSANKLEFFKSTNTVFLNKPIPDLPSTVKLESSR